MNRSFKGVLFFVLMTLAFGLGAQTVTLTFTGRGSDNSYVRIDRVVITNLSKSWQETIWWPDTTLTMQNGTGIDVYSENVGFALSQNNPNPFSSTTDVSLAVAEEGKVQLEISDMNGHAVVEPKHFTSLQPGNHQFRVSLSTVGTYVMTARQNGKLTSIKMICNGGGGANAIDYLGSMQSLTYVLKSSTTNPFNFGNMMEYVGYATINGAEMESQRITQAQGASQTFMLQFAGTQLPGQPCPNAATVTDIDGNTYNTVQIGQQCWMRENLRTKRYADGTVIHCGNTDQSTNTAYYYYPNHDSSNVSTYGLLYNWKAVMRNSLPSNDIPSGVQGICPSGWHVPSKAEWGLLMDYVSNQNQYICVFPSATSVNDIAKALASTIGWNSSTNTCAVGNNPNNNNATGLDVLPSGYFGGAYGLFGKEGTLWSSTFIESEESMGDSGFVEVKELYYESSHVTPVRTYRVSGYPVRCVYGAGSTVSVPDAPTGVYAAVTSNSQIMVAWSPVPNAGTYRVYRSSTPNGTYSQIGFLTTETLLYDNSPLTGNNYYKVTAVNNAGESPYSSVVDAYYSGPGVPTGVSATVSGAQIYVSWNSVSNATSYKVYRRSNNQGPYSLIGSPTSNNYYDDSPLSGANYYKVKAVNSAGESYYSAYAYCNYPGSTTAPSAPTGVSATVSGSQVYVSWSSVTNATSYKVYRSSSANGTFTQIGSETSNTYLYDSSPLTGYNYYKIKAVNSAGESDYSSYASCNYITVPDAPTNVAATLSGSQIQITWNSVSNATSYKVYRSSSANGTYTQIGSATSSTYLYDSSPLTGYNYYKVTAVNSAGESVFSSYALCNYITVPDAPTNVSATLSGSQIQITWNSVSNATSYKVYRSSTANGTYSQISSATTNTYLYDSSPLTGYNYYKVTAMNSAGESSYSSYTYCNFVTVPSAPTNVNASVSGTQVYVSWGAVSNATSYKVYRSSSANGTYSQIGSATSNTYLYDSNPMTGYNYYKVKAVNSAGESSYSTYASCNYSGGATVPSAPTGVSATQSGTQIHITWNSVSNATSYIVYRSSSANGAYSQIGAQTSNTYIYDNSPMSGYNYYKVKAVNSSGMSDYSMYGYIYYNMPAPNAPTNVTATASATQVCVSWDSDEPYFKVYRSSSMYGAYTQLGSTISYLYYCDENPLTGYNYYKVKAVNSAGQESGYSSVVSCNYDPTSIAPCIVSNLSVSGTSSQTLSWTYQALTGCGTPTAYDILKYDPCDGQWPVIATKTTTSYNVPSSYIHPGTNRYIVRPKNNGGYGSINYANSSSVSLSAPSSFTVQKLSGGYLKFTWSAVSKATGYQIFMSDSPSPNSGYGIMSNGWISGGSTTTATIYYPGSSGTTMYFKMKSFYDCGDYWELSNFTSTYKSITF